MIPSTVGARVILITHALVASVGGPPAPFRPAIGSGGTSVPVGGGLMAESETTAFIEAEGVSVNVREVAAFLADSPDDEWNRLERHAARRAC